MKAPPAYPYPDPYYRSIFTPYDAQPYPPQPYGGQPMVGSLSVFHNVDKFVKHLYFLLRHRVDRYVGEN